MEQSLITDVFIWAITAGLAAIFGAIMFAIKLVLKTLSRLDALTKSDAVQSENINTLIPVTRLMIRALRSHSYALQELGANGSTERALNHVNDAEDMINNRADQNGAAAMSNKPA